MALGISTACLYPMVVEESLKTLIGLNFRVFEIFINTNSELRPDFLRGLNRQLRDTGGRVKSIHPFTSGFESYLLFSGYERRFLDGVDFYKRYFEAARELGAEIVVIHGDRSSSQSVISDKEYYERFGILAQTAKQYGITLAQENVNDFRSQDYGFLRGMRDYLGELGNFVLDLKQAVRSGRDPFETLRAMGEGVVHVHLNDHVPGRDCLLPGQGQMDYRRLMGMLGQYGYHGDFVIEVYRKDFQEPRELQNAWEYLKKQGVS